MSENFLIAIVDDNASVRDALKSLIESVGLEAEAFPSAEAFLKSDHRGDTACLILDLRMPGMSGLELQKQLVAARSPVSIIFISAHGDEEARARALEAGALDFLNKPFSEEALLNDVRSALGYDRGRNI